MEEIVTIPFVAHESAMNRIERMQESTKKKMLAIIIIEAIIIALMIVGIAIYLCLPSEVEDVTQKINDVKDSEIKQSVGDK